jgi:hypothetical protein
MARTESRDAAIFKIVALVGGNTAIAIECVHRELNAVLRDLRWEGCLEREACKVLSLTNVSEALSAAYMTDRMRLQDTTASSSQIDKGISTRDSKGADGKQGVSRAKTLKTKTPTSPVPPVDEEPEQHKHKKQRRHGADEPLTPTQRVDTTGKKGKEKKGKGSKADRQLPQATAVNTGRKPSREERSVTASMRLFAGMDRETEASAKSQQRKDIKHAEDLECEATIVRDLIANTHTIDSDKREALTEEMEER